MAEPKIRFKADDGTDYEEWTKFVVADAFEKIKFKNRDGKIANVITNSAEYGLIPQRMYFDKEIAVEGNTGNYTIISRGDFVYNPRKSSTAPMGPFNRYNYDEEGIVSPLYTCLKPKGKLDSDYLLWYFQTDKWHQFVSDNGAQNGARHDRVGMTDAIMMSIPIVAPEEEEQQKIANFLSNVDEVIAVSEEEVANLEKQKKAVMQKIFSQEVRFKKEDGSDFPDWEEKPLGDIVGKISSGKDKVSQGTAILYGSMGPIGMCDNATYCGRKILIARVGANAGTANIVNVDCGVSDNTLIIIDKGYCCLVWLFFCLCYMDVGKMRFGGGQPLVTGSMLQNLQIEFPSLPEQQLIADFLTNYDEAITAAKQELDKWKKLKKGLLQQMFV